MSIKIGFQMKLEGAKNEMIRGLIDAAERAVDNMGEELKKVLLIKLVTHAILQDAGATGPLDTVDALQDSGVYIGDAARRKMLEPEEEGNSEVKGDEA